MLAAALRLAAITGALAITVAGVAAPDAWQRHQAAADAALLEADWDDAETELTAALELAVHFSDGDQRLATTLHRLAAIRSAWIGSGQTPRADAVGERFVSLAAAQRGPEHPVTLEVERSLAQSDHMSHRYPPAIERLQRLRATAMRTLGTGDRRTVRLGRMLAEVMSDAGRNLQANGVALKTLHQALPALGRRSPEVARTRAVLAMVTARRGVIDEALKIAAGMKGRPAAGGWQGARMCLALATALRQGARPVEGLEWAEQALAAHELHYPKDSPMLLEALRELVRAGLANAQPAVAKDATRRIVQIAEAATEPGPRASMLIVAAEAELAVERIDEAAAHLEESRGLLAEARADWDQLAPVLFRLATAEIRRGERARGKELYELVANQARAGAGAERQRAIALNNLADLAIEAGDVAEAEALLERSVALVPLGPRDADRRDTLGQIRLAQGRAAEARALFEAALEHGTAEQRVLMLEHLRDALSALGLADEAAAVETQIAEARAPVVQRGPATESQRFNFRLAGALPGWKELEPGTLSIFSVVERSRRSPPTFFLLLAGEVGADVDPAADAQAWAAALALDIADYQLLGGAERTWNGMDGWLVEVKGSLQGRRTDWSTWVTIQRGIAYRFVLFADEFRFRREDLARELELLVRDFSLIDAERPEAPSSQVRRSGDSRWSFAWQPSPARHPAADAIDWPAFAQERTQ